MPLHGGMGYGTNCGKWGLKVKMWRVVRSLYVNNRSCIVLEGRSSDYFSINQWLIKVAPFPQKFVFNLYLWFIV